MGKKIECKYNFPPLLEPPPPLVPLGLIQRISSPVGVVLCMATSDLPVILVKGFVLIVPEEFITTAESEVGLAGLFIFPFISFF